MGLHYKTTFYVEGTGEFPLDMLRYDGCYPATSDDAYSIGRNYEREDGDFVAVSRRVKLEKIHGNKQPYITFDRWKSFGWKVVQGPDDPYIGYLNTERRT